MKELWDYNNKFLVSSLTGKITSDGIITYWQSISASVSFNTKIGIKTKKSSEKKVDKKATATTSEPAMHIDHRNSDTSLVPDDRSFTPHDRFHWMNHQTHAPNRVR